MFLEITFLSPYSPAQHWLQDFKCSLYHVQMLEGLEQLSTIVFFFKFYFQLRFFKYRFRFNFLPYLV